MAFFLPNPFSKAKLSKLPPHFFAKVTATLDAAGVNTIAEHAVAGWPAADAITWIMVFNASPWVC